jgi:hypothetical protein
MPPASNDSLAWGLGAAVVAAVLVIGGIMLYNSDRGTQTASTQTPNAQSTPSPNVGKTAPPPARSQ